MICLIEKENPNKWAYLSIGQASKDSLQPGVRTFGSAAGWIILWIYLTSVFYFFGLSTHCSNDVDDCQMQKPKKVMGKRSHGT